MYKKWASCYKKRKDSRQLTIVNPSFPILIYLVPTYMYIYIYISSFVYLVPDDVKISVVSDVDLSLFLFPPLDIFKHFFSSYE